MSWQDLIRQVKVDILINIIKLSLHSQKKAIMSEKSFPKKKKLPDLVHLDSFLEETLAGFSDPKKRDDIFDAKDFFENVRSRSELAEYGSEDNFVASIVNRLDEYVPQLYMALESRGDIDTVKIELYEEWLDFLVNENVEQDRAVDTILFHGHEWLWQNTHKFETAYSLYAAAISAFSSMTVEKENGEIKLSDQISQDSKTNIGEFIIDHSEWVLCSYARISSDGLDRSEIDYETAIKGRSNSFISYAQKAVKTYAEGINLLLDTMPKDKIHDYAVGIYTPMQEATQRSMTGHWYVDSYNNDHETLIPDMHTQTTCLIFSLTALRKNATKNEFAHYVFEEVPDVLAKSIEYFEPEGGYDLYNAVMHLFGSNMDGKHQFARTYGTRSVLAMADKYPEQAALILTDIRNLLDINKNDVLILNNPASDNAVPFAVSAKAPDERYEGSEHDLVLLFQGVSNVLLRNNLDQDAEFNSIITNQRSYDQYRLIIGAVNEAKNMTLQNPDVTHHGEYLHSCPISALIPKAE